MKRIDRRDFLKILGMVGLTAVVPWPVRLARAQSFDPTDPYDGPIFVSIAASGGWDPTSFCDPKPNVPGEPVINHWAQTAEVQTIAGSEVTYAPFASNQEFFERFAADMLVLNGVDCETNSHDVGIRNNWSGRIPTGYPSFSAIAAAVYGAGLPLPFLTNGGYRETAGLVTYTEVQGARDLQDLVNANRVPRSDRLYHDTDELALIDSYQQARVEAQGGPGTLPREQRALNNLTYARGSRDQLRELALSLPTQLASSTDKDGNSNALLQQSQLALACCSAGLTVACDLEIGGFDTHGNHDTSHRSAMQRLTNGVLYLWDTAEALGLADRLVVLVGSDFGRTPWYNSGNGKDHWPIGSAVIMKKGAAWANRVVGASDEGHRALAINPTTLAVDGSGVKLTPAHVHETFRKIAGIDRHAITLRFPLDAPNIDVLGG